MFLKFLSESIFLNVLTDFYTNLPIYFLNISVKIDEPDKKKRKQNESKEDTQNPNSKASDDFHFEKFKKQFRRY